MNQVTLMPTFGSKFCSWYFLSMKVKSIWSSSAGGTRHKSRGAIHTDYNMDSIFIF